MLVAFPLLIIPVAIYNMIAFLTPPDNGWVFPLVTVRLVSGKDWPVTIGDALIGLTLVLLLFETVKAVRPGAKSVIDHLLSVLVFIGAMTELVMVDQAATSTFATLCAICLIDAIGGIAISIRVGRAGAVGSIGSSHVPPPASTPPDPVPPPEPAPPPEPTHQVHTPDLPLPPPAPAPAPAPEPVRPAPSPVPDTAQPDPAPSHRTS